MKIDVFPHVMPRRYFDRMLQVAPPGMALQKRMPFVWLLDSAGARIQEAAGSLFAGSGHLFREEVEMSGVIQMVAAMISFVLGVGLFSLGFLALALPANSDWQTQVIAYFDLFKHMHDFARGVVDTRAVIFYLSTTFVFLFLTLRVVESRRWK